MEKKLSDLSDIDEVQIMEETPTKIKVGNRYILIRQLTLKEFFWLSKKLLWLYMKYTKNIAETYGLIEKQEENWRKRILNFMIIAFKIDGLRKDILDLLNKLFPIVGRKFLFGQSYLERKATINDLIQIIFALYRYNFVDVKKNFIQLLKIMEMKESVISETLKSFSKENSIGKKGEPLTPRFVKSNSTRKNTKEFSI